MEFVKYFVPSPLTPLSNGYYPFAFSVPSQVVPKNKMGNMILFDDRYVLQSSRNHFDLILKDLIIADNVPDAD